MNWSLFCGLGAAATLATALSFMPPASAASFECVDDSLNPAERRICETPALGALDERLDSWYLRALVRAGYFDQTEEVRSEQRAWLESRDACGTSRWCIRRHYRERIEALKNYVEHV